MVASGAVELREYLRRINPPPNAAFDEFVGNIEILFKLRVKAEDRFIERPHTARNRGGALALDWSDIAAVLSPNEDCPPENAITQFARDNLAIIEEILSGLRRVLVRSLQKVNLGLVQQVDSHCLRWLTRQPGRDGVEKAGPNQRILAVVRREDFNTLENRVFKDFLVRAGQDAAIYLRKNEARFSHNETIERVRRLRRMCEQGLRLPQFESVAMVSELPVPNYVLRHDRRYNRIWKAYVDMVRQAAVAERLWNRRKEVTEVLSTLKNQCSRHTDPRARFHSPIWFNPLDGNNPLLDAPFFRNESSEKAIESAPYTALHDVVIDLVGGSLGWDLLIYGRHHNAKPYLQDYRRPSIETADSHVYLEEILERKDTSALHEYLEQLHAKVGGKRWLILVPDHWDPLWQEAVIKASPLSRRNVLLIWRSVAAIIGANCRLNAFRDGEEIAVVDVHQDGTLLISRLHLTQTGDSIGVVPQRKAYKNGAETGRFYSVKMRSANLRRLPPTLVTPTPIEPRLHRYLWPVSSKLSTFLENSDRLIIVSEGQVAIPHSLPRDCSLLCNHGVLTAGAIEVAAKLESGGVPYYDQLEALSLIVQTDDEDIAAKTLVPANENWPGGRAMQTTLLRRAAVLPRGENHVKFLLCMGEVMRDAPLRVKRHSFPAALDEDYPLDLAVRMMPGQGMANIEVHAQFIREPIELDFLNGMSDVDETGRRIDIIGLEEKMLRSFPPDPPHVVADSHLWQQVQGKVQLWLRNAGPLDGGWFAKPEDLYPRDVPLPDGVLPIERLRRKNVFGNAPGRELPTNEDFSHLFLKLRQAYDSTKPSSESPTLYSEVMRLIAWTYQSGNPLFHDVRVQTVKRIFAYARGYMYARPLPQEYTLCANLCSDIGEWMSLWSAIKLRLQDRTVRNAVDEDLRLLYNLLQFHPTFLLDTGLYESNECWDMVALLIYWYERYNEVGGTGSKRMGFILKCILYLLRRRKFDGKRFLTAGRDNDRYRHVRACLKHPPRASAKRELHRVVCDYLDGKGTIEGIPTS